jgi:hypothetical protein
MFLAEEGKKLFELVEQEASNISSVITSGKNFRKSFSVRVPFSLRNS